LLLQATLLITGRKGYGLFSILVRYLIYLRDTLQIKYFNKDINIAIKYLNKKIEFYSKKNS